MEGHFSEQERFYTTIGTVVDDRRWSETRVHGDSYGGGGWVGPQGGNVAAPTVSVSSTVTNQMQLFMVGEDGKEFDLQFHNIPIGVRAGHRVAVLYAENLQSGRKMAAALINLTTGRSSRFGDAVKKLGPGTPKGGCAIPDWLALPLLAGAAAWFTSDWTFDIEREVSDNNFEVTAYPWWPIVFLGVIIAGSLISRRNRRFAKDEKQLRVFHKEEVIAELDREIAKVLAEHGDHHQEEGR